MSAGARRLAPTERDRRKPPRARPKQQIVARISMFERGRETDWTTVERHFTVVKQRVRSEKFCKANVDKAPGEDGCRWRCTCPAQACGHVADLLIARNVVERALPNCEGRMLRRESLVGILHVTLTKLGEELLRWRWAAQALKDTT